MLAVELAKPKNLLDFALSPKVTDMVAGHPMFEKATAQPKFFQSMLVVHYLEARLGTDWRTGLHGLLDGGIAWAVTADGGMLLTVDAKDAGMLSKLHDIVVQFAKGEAKKNGQGGGMTSAEYRRRDRVDDRRGGSPRDHRQPPAACQPAPGAQGGHRPPRRTPRRRV